MDRSIVVVDDEQGILDVLCDLLEMEGYQPICLSGPDEVESAAREVTPCLFMIDIMLPGISGIELAAHLRQSGFSDTPMVAMSASQLMVTTAQKANLFQDVISKPFDLDRVLTTVARHASSYQAN